MYVEIVWRGDDMLVATVDHSELLGPPGSKATLWARSGDEEWSA